MTNVENLSKWIADPHRSYDAGVSIFCKLGTEAQKVNYEAYFRSVSGNLPIFDAHFTLLVNQLVRIERGIMVEPALYPTAQDELEEVRDVAAELREQHQEKIEAIEDELENMRNEMLALMEDQDVDHSERADDLSERIHAHEAEIERLKKAVEELEKPGVKVVTYDSMPKKIKAKYERIRAIAPDYAMLHASLVYDQLSDDERKEVANKLCDLDDERRKLWDYIDHWSEGKVNAAAFDIERPAYSDNQVVRGYEMARAVKRLKQNIASSLKSAEKAKADGKQTIYDNAMRRIEGYQAELDAIEKELNGQDAE